MHTTRFRERKSSRVLEFFVVVSVIAAITSVGFSFLSSAGAEARDAKRIGDISHLRKALHFYYTEHGEYPVTGWVHSGDDTWQELITALSPYTSYVPVDPRNQKYRGPVYKTGAVNYGYFSSGVDGEIGGRGDYVLYFNVENDTSITSFRSPAPSLIDNVGIGVTQYPIADGAYVYSIRAPQ